jgi:glutathione peroxidase
MKRILVFIAIIAIVLLIIKQKDMTLKQSIMKTIYPLIMLKGKLPGSKEGILQNKNNIKPKASFYQLDAFKNDGTPFGFNELKGKKVLIVNTASDCGYTGQYEELQKLHEQYKDKLVILGFPANDFKEQEKGTDNDIATFCKVNYGVTFQLMKKSSVIKGDVQNQIYQWLTDENKNGWNTKAPQWNFAKYLINEEGVLTHYFSSDVSPLSKQVKDNL